MTPTCDTRALEERKLCQGRNVNRKWCEIRIRISGLIRTTMSVESLPKCYGFIALSASRISPSSVYRNGETERNLTKPGETKRNRLKFCIQDNWAMLLYSIDIPQQWTHKTSFFCFIEVQVSFKDKPRRSIFCTGPTDFSASRQTDIWLQLVNLTDWQRK